MAPIRPIAPKKKFKERLIAQGRKSKNIEDSRSDTMGYDAETKQIFLEMQKEKSMEPALREKTPVKKWTKNNEENPVKRASTNPEVIIRRRPGPATKFQKDNEFFKHTQTDKLSRKSPRVK